MLQCRIFARYLFYAAMLCAAACSGPAADDNRHTALVDSLLHQTALLLEKGEPADAAFRFLDSVYTRFDAGAEDLFRKYNFKRDYDLHQLKRTQEAMLYADSMLALAQQHTEDKPARERLATAYFSKGDVFFEQKNYSEAYEHYFQGKIIAGQLMDRCVISQYSYRLGMVSYKQTRYAEAAVHFLQGFEESASCDSSVSIFAYRQELLSNAALSYANLNEPDSAIAYYDRVIRFIDSYGKSYVTDQFVAMAKGVVYGNLADVYEKKGDTAKAEQLLLQAVAINTQKGFDTRDGQYSRLKLAYIYIRTGRMQEARTLLDLTRAELSVSKDVEGIVLWNKVSWRYYDQLGDTKRAYHYLQHYIDLRDAKMKRNRKLVNTDVNTELENIEHSYESDLLKKENELKNAYLLIGLLFSVIIVVVMLSTWLSWRRSKKHVNVLTSLHKQLSVKNAQLEQSNKDKDRIMRVLAHDLRNPLAAVSGITGLMLEEPGRSAEDQEMLQMLKTSSDNSVNMIRDIMDLTLSTAARELHKEPVELQHLLQQCVGLLQFKAGEKQQHIVLEPHAPVTVSMSREGIWRVTNNLLVNAIKFSPAQASITVAVHELPGFVRVNVEDNGIGIPEELRSSIFDTFTSAKRYGTSGEQPFGLGLSISRQIVEAHRGRMDFESKAAGGTIFYFELPF